MTIHLLGESNPANIVDTKELQDLVGNMWPSDLLEIVKAHNAKKTEDLACVSCGRPSWSYSPADEPRCIDCLGNNAPKANKS